MIEKIDINNIATYTEYRSINPLKINFFYGSNGSGKSTLANIIGEESYYPDCNVKWEEGRKLPVLVYNKKFVKENFGLKENINGIFTLGKDMKEAQEYIAEKREAAQECSRLINNYNTSKNNLNGKINIINNNFEELCWSVQQKFGAQFSNALSGFRKSKKAFSAKCLEEYKKMKVVHSPNLKEIEKIYNIAFSKRKETYSFYKILDIDKIIKNENCPFLELRITGKNDTPIGKFIEYLQNSDWIKEGIGYVEKAAGRCPYCQQILPENIQKDIEAFFDKDYEEKCALVANFEQQYISFTNTLINQLNSIIKNPIPLLEYDILKLEFEVLYAKIDSNKKIIKEKLMSPSAKVTIDSIAPVAERINEIIKNFNEEIKKNNDIVQNQINEQERCKKLIWQIIIYELQTSIQQYKKQYDGYMKGIETLTKKIEEQSNQKSILRTLINEKEETLTSVKPTVNAINRILERFGFYGFRLAENNSEKSTYKIIRPDGSNAKDTLSEGEYNFVTFLYFYHLIYGSKDKTGIANEKVIVIDDPISSLDSNVLFIISTLVKLLLNDCIEGKNGIKQIFILTHNVYFHKEVTFLGSRREYPTTNTAYWIIKKIKNVSNIIYYKENPIKTSYELLWAELKVADKQQPVTIFNTLRRILEYYFNVIGGMDYEKCINQFEGEDKIVCKSLISCINDGSHFITDDFVMCYESETMDNYLRVFKLIFEKMNHKDHYNMMMRHPEDLAEAAITTE